MKKLFVCVGLFFFSGLLIAQSQFQVGDLVYAEWSSGGYYKATVSKVEGDIIEVKWQDGSSPTPLDAKKIRPRKDHGLRRDQIADWDASDEGAKKPGELTLWEVLPLSGKKAGKQVYAMYTNGLYYKAVELEKKGADTLVRWDDNSGEMWTNSVKPRKGHGLKSDLIGDRELTKAELAEREKAKQVDTTKYEISCSKLRSRLDCMRTFDPCVWSDRTGCAYRGY